MIFDGRHGAQIMEAGENRRTWCEFVDARGNAFAEVLLEKCRLIAGDKAIVSGPQWVGNSEQARPEVLERAAVHPAALVGGGDENDVPDLWISVEKQGVTEEGTIVRLADECFKALIGNESPEAGPRVHDHHLDEQPAHAVADQDHAIETRVGLLGVKLATAQVVRLR